MSEIWLKLRMLRLYGFHLREWWNDVWKQEAGQRMCCDGHMCGCQGSDYGSMWEHMLRPLPKATPEDRS